MIDAASETGAVLAVGHYRRFFANIQRLRDVLTDDLLGGDITYEYEEGGVFSWPSHSRFVFDKAKAGGGVLMDAGVHGLDLASWLFGRPRVAAYHDDNLGGMEANAIVELEHPAGVSGTIELSRTRRLNNKLTVTGSRAAVALSVWTPSHWRVVQGTLPPEYCRAPSSPNQANDAFAAQLIDFAAAIHGERPPMVGGEEGQEVVSLVEECYSSRQPLELPWLGPPEGLSA